MANVDAQYKELMSAPWFETDSKPVEFDVPELEDGENIDDVLAELGIA